jgi:hypothetical protein
VKCHVVVATSVAQIANVVRPRARRPDPRQLPLTSRSASLDEAKGGKRDILVGPGEGSSWTTPYRYKLSNDHYLLPTPGLTAISPLRVPNDSVTAGVRGATVKLTGSNFLPISRVILTRVLVENIPAGMNRTNDVESLSPKFVDAQHLELDLFDGIPREPAKWRVKVVNRAAESKELLLTVIPTSGPEVIR